MGVDDFFNPHGGSTTNSSPSQPTIVELSAQMAQLLHMQTLAPNLILNQDPILMTSNSIRNQDPILTTPNPTPTMMTTTPTSTPKTTSTPTPMMTPTPNLSLIQTPTPISTPTPALTQAQIPIRIPTQPDIHNKEILGHGTKRGGLYYVDDFSPGVANSVTHPFDN
ncbi:unnamed protein product [Prunus armeniaca]